MARETAQTLDRGLRVLEWVSQSRSGLSVTELAARLQVGRTVVYRLVATLEEHGLVRRDSSGRVRIGAGSLRLAARVRPVLAEASLPVLRTLAEEVGATAHLTVAEGEDCVALAVVEPSWTDFHVAYRVGTRHPIGRGAAGRALASLREKQPELQASEGELQPGAHGVAAPIVGIPGFEASVGVVAMQQLPPTTAAQVMQAAHSLRLALSAEPRVDDPPTTRRPPRPGAVSGSGSDAPER
jgi:DNA-binding IclR family transcriptional regulator